MFHSGVENIKKEEIKLQPTNVSDFSPSSSVMSFSSGNYPSLDELSNLKTERSDHVPTLLSVIELVCNKKNNLKLESFRHTLMIQFVDSKREKTNVFEKCLKLYIRVLNSKYAAISLQVSFLFCKVYKIKTALN